MLFHDRLAFLLNKCDPCRRAPVGPNSCASVVANGRRRQRPTFAWGRIVANGGRRPLKAPDVVHCAAAIWQSSRPLGMLLLLLILLLEANGCCCLHLELEPLLLLPLRLPLLLPP